MPQNQKKPPPQGPSEKVLETIGKIVPGFHGFFKRIEGSKTFGPRLTEIRKEIDRRFGGVKK